MPSSVPEQNDAGLVAILASGMVTAAGFNSRSTCAAIRAGVSGVRTGNIPDPSVGEGLPAGRPDPPQWWEGPDMLAELAAPAVLECFDSLPPGTDRSKVPVFVLLSPLDRPHRPADLDRIVLDALVDRLPFDLDSESGVLHSGRTGVLAAFLRARGLFGGRHATHAVIVGADSFLRRPVVEAYMERRRVLTGDNSNGFIPGEAACAVLIAPSRERGGPELRIVGWGGGRETGTIDSEEPLTGDGLTAAVREALARPKVKMAETKYWLTDQNAEHYKAKECTLVQARLLRRNRPGLPAYEIWNPIEYLGDIGSAIGPCLLGLALVASRGGYAPGPMALMHVGEDDGDRAAFVLQWTEAK